MVDLVTALRIIGGVGLLLANGFFVTTEFALTRVRQFTEEEFSTAGLGLAWDMTERLEIYLSGCQVGITISSVGLGVVAEPAVASVLDPTLQSLGLASATGSGHTAMSVILALGIINLLHVIVGEQAPTYLGIERTKLIAGYGAPPLYWWTKLMYPVIIVSDRIAKAILSVFGVQIARSWADEELEETTTRGELRTEMGNALAGIGIPADRREEILGALDIGTMTVDSIMVDRDDIVAVSTTDSLERNIDRMGHSPHVRFPLIGEELEEFLGVVYTPAILREPEALCNESLDLHDVASPPMTVSPSTVVSDLIDNFQRENQELALVVEDETVLGLVTATDALEEITGELEDPLDIANS